jgi:N-hydroxyarylamine O-acetyltransferase
MSWTQAYLTFLGLTPEPPSLAFLRRLTERHLLRVPFENVTTLLRFRDSRGGVPPDPDPEVLLRLWIERRAGGLCYEVARTFGRLLQELGFEVCDVSGDITWPDSHQALQVEVGGRRWLIDAGNGAPFFAPIPLDAVVELDHAGLRYRFRPGEKASHVQDRWMDGRWQPFCVLYDAPPSPARLRTAFCRHHVPGEGKFVGELTLVRCRPDGLDRLHNRTLTRFAAAGRRDEILDEPGLGRAAGEVFGLPHLPIGEAVAVLRDLGAWREP